MKRGAVVVENVGKRFRKQDRWRPSTFKGMIVNRHWRSGESWFWGLRNVGFHIAAGRSVGVVGRNGAGKSTLLRMIGGVIRPDEGRIQVAGRIGALLEISAGLTEDLTGRENIFLIGVIAGMTRAEVEGRFDEIVAFSELDEFIDRPIRTYSTGMKMRLAFAVAVHVEPEILLIDEVLAVGDAAFQAKCLDRIDMIKAAGCTIFLVSHDAGQIRSLCDDVLFLKEGRVVAYGPTEETMALYDAMTDDAVASAHSATALPQTAPDPAQNVNRFGSREAEIGRVELIGADGLPTGGIRSGDGLAVRFAYRSERQIENVIALVGIYTADLTCCLEVDTLHDGPPVSSGPEERTMLLRFDRLDLPEGEYRITVGLFSADWHTVFDYHTEAYPFAVVGRPMKKGVLRPPLSWSTEPGS